MPEVRVRRSPGGYRDLLRSYRILVDGVDQAGVGEGDVVDFDVPAGMRTFEATIDWTRSRPLEIEARDGESIVLEVEKGPWIALFRRYGYLRLRAVGADGPRTEESAMSHRTYLAWSASIVGIGILLTVAQLFVDGVSAGDFVALVGIPLGLFAVTMVRRNSTGG